MKEEIINEFFHRLCKLEGAQIFLKVDFGDVVNVYETMMREIKIENKEPANGVDAVIKICNHSIEQHEKTMHTLADRIKKAADEINEDLLNVRRAQRENKEIHIVHHCGGDHIIPDCYGNYINTACMGICENCPYKPQCVKKTMGDERYFIKIKDPQEDDIKHAQEVMKHWRKNFEIVDVTPHD